MKKALSIRLGIQNRVPGEPLKASFVFVTVMAAARAEAAAVESVMQTRNRIVRHRILLAQR
jgi:hypothetical protein